MMMMVMMMMMLTMMIDDDDADAAAYDVVDDDDDDDDDDGAGAAPAAAVGAAAVGAAAVGAAAAAAAAPDAHSRPPSLHCLQLTREHAQLSGSRIRTESRQEAMHLRKAQAKTPGYSWAEGRCRVGVVLVATLCFHDMTHFGHALSMI